MIGMKIKDYKEMNNISARKISEKINNEVTDVTIYNCLSSPHKVSKKVFMMVAQAVGMPLDEASKEWDGSKIPADVDDESILFYKMTSGLSFEDISEQLHLRYGFDKNCKSTSFKAIKTPERTQMETFLNVAEIVNMPRDEALKQWREAKINYYSDKYMGE